MGARRLAVGDEGLTVVQTAEPGVGGGIHQLVRVGNAVLVTVSDGE